ncbi:MAG: hypothetical protein ABI648_01270 [Betaproteobacteria bacterium]
MDAHELQSMLSRMTAVRHTCDLDLLLFFHRHPRALLTSERIADWLGYERDKVAQSLDQLIDARLLTSLQNAARPARMYVLQWGAVPDGLMSQFMKIAATRQGRQDLMRLLRTAGTDRADVGRPQRASVTSNA